MKIEWCDFISGILIAITGIILSLSSFGMALKSNIILYSAIFTAAGTLMIGLIIVGILLTLVSIELENPVNGDR
jgi:hypothetical protein